MAPEQAGGASELDERADIYALGAILRFLLTGEAPPIASEPGGPRAPAPDTRRWSGRIPPPLEAICRKAMAIRPENRYSSVPEMSAEAARFLTGARVQAYPESVLERARRFAARHRTAIVLIAVYLAMRLSLILWRRS
ncbi:MAG TPA: protein kinase, partial [Myxococcaceae bacterium]|nr:protein kinase [Myxococcaceae bacterium]